MDIVEVKNDVQEQWLKMWKMRLCEDDLDEVDDAVHDVPADGTIFFCKVVGEGVVIEPPLGDAIADAEGKTPE